MRPSTKTTISEEEVTPKILHDRVLKAIEEIEAKRNALLTNKQRIGRVVETSNVKLEHQIRYRRAPFQWQRMSKLIGKGATSSVYTAMNCKLIS